MVDTDLEDEEEAVGDTGREVVTAEAVVVRKCLSFHGCESRPMVTYEDSCEETHRHVSCTPRTIKYRPVSLFPCIPSCVQLMRSSWLWLLTLVIIQYPSALRDIDSVQSWWNSRSQPEAQCIRSLHCCVHSPLGYAHMDEKSGK